MGCIALIVNRFRDKRKKNGTKRNETETILLKWGRSYSLYQDMIPYQDYGTYRRLMLITWGGKVSTLLGR